VQEKKWVFFKKTGCFSGKWGILQKNGVFFRKMGAVLMPAGIFDACVKSQN